MAGDNYDISRVKNFIDAVFSIALTILILDIDIIDMRGKNIGYLLNEKMPEFIGYVVSFFVIALFWASHVRNFRYCSYVDHKLIMVNLLNLFFVVLLPFSTKLYVQNFANGPAFMWYSFNIAILGLMSTWIVLTMYSKNKSQDFNVYRKRQYSLLGLSVFFVWGTAGLIGDLFPWTARVLFILIFVIDFFINRYFNKKVSQLEQA